MHEVKLHPSCREMRLTFIEAHPRIIPVNDVLSSLISLGGWIGAAELFVAYCLAQRHRQRLLPAGGHQYPVHGEAGLHRPALA